VQSSLVFFNIDYVRDRIRWIVDRLPQSTRWFMLDAEAVTTIDSTAAADLGEISEELSRRNLRFGVANLHAQPRELLSRSGFLARIGPEMSFTRLEDAALAFRKAQGSSPLSCDDRPPINRSTEYFAVVIVLRR
jgi:sulfate permease, SulP family